MKRGPVKSSNIKSAGYGQGVIEVEFQDGAIYQQACDEAKYERFLSAPSKGRFVRAEFPDLMRVGTKAAPREMKPAPRETIVPVSETESLIVEMFEWDNCCILAFQEASLAGELNTNVWTCPKCGCLWLGHTNTEASIRTWRPQEMIEILRMNR